MAPTILYCITCKTTGKMYVGITAQTLSRRWGQHVRRSSMLRTKLSGAIVQYGPDDFLVEPLHKYSSPQDALAAEEELIACLDLTTAGYNMSHGGDVCPMWNRRHTEEARRLMSERQRGKKRGPHSEETKRKIAASLKGRRHDPARIAKMASTRKGVKLGPQSIEHRAKIANAKKNYVFTPEHCAAIAAGRRGIKPTAETRAKMSASHRARYDLKRQAVGVQ